MVVRQRPLDAELPLPDEVLYEDHVEHDPFAAVRDPGMTVSRMHSQAPEIDPLGLRNINTGRTWGDLSNVDGTGLAPERIQTFLRQFKSSFNQQPARGTTVSYDQMSDAQKQVIRLCRQQASSDDFVIKKVIVQGKAGTGKSAVIKEMCRLLDQISPSLYLALAFTGAAAVNIDGKC